MTAASEMRAQIIQQLEDLPPDKLRRLAEFLQFLTSQEHPTPPAAPSNQRQPGLHPHAFAASDDFDEPLPDSFWLGEV
ncbi:MAG: DUF2281 domain-containing protein [Spirulinaceae cyanobacterium SM2_1_0]|nr:DUF2281 domain-containing protein [Spirulinaceae cyanobacterium SM2_1_0]